MLARSSASNLVQTPKLATICLRVAIDIYELILAKTKQVEKSKKMAMSTLNSFVGLFGADFDVALIDDALIEEKWIPNRQTEVAHTAVKRDLSFIRKFVEWASDPKRKYCPTPLTFNFDAKSEHYEYFDASDLKLIFDAIPNKAQNAWQFCIPLIGLYTGARISEPASMMVKHVFNKAGLDVMYLPGTKTDASPRDIPIHTDLITLGFLDYVNYRKSLSKGMLFDITFS